MKHLSLVDLPLNPFGIPTRETISHYIDEQTGLGVKNWFGKEGRIGLTVYCGASVGNDPVFAEQAERFAKRCNEIGAVAVNGGIGMPNSMMDLSTRGLERLISFNPILFSDFLDLKTTEGLNPYAMNLIVTDFYERKVGMGLMGDSAIVLPGGYGSLDEAFESIIFGAETNKKTFFVGPKNYWENTRHFLNNLQRVGLIPAHYMNHFEFTENADEAVDKALHLFKTQSAGTKAHGSFVQKSETSLRRYLSEGGNEKLQEAITTFQSDTHSPYRIGLIASGNIGNTFKTFNLSDATKRALICADSATIGKEMAELGGTLVIAGTNEGLRRTVASECLKNNGRVIWVRKSVAPSPLHMRQKNKQELVLSVSRQCDVDRMIALLCQGVIGISGGIHTADRVFSSLTRNQTRHGGFCDVKPWAAEFDAPRPTIYLLDPLLGNGQSLWHSLKEQVHHSKESGFIRPGDVSLLDMRNDPRGIAAMAMETAKSQPDFVKASCTPQEPATPAHAKICKFLESCAL